MTFQLVNQGQWATGDALTSAQMNALQVQNFNSLDKSLAGDTLNGGILMAGTAFISASTLGAQIVSNVNSGFFVNAAGGLNLFAANSVQMVPGAIQASVAGAIEATIAGGITSTVAAGIKPGVVGGITSGIAGGIKAGFGFGIEGDVSAGIVATTPGGIASNVDNGIALSGSGADYLFYSTPRTVTRVVPFWKNLLAVSVASGGAIAATLPGVFPNFGWGYNISGPVIASVNGTGAMAWQTLAANAASNPAYSYFMPLDEYIYNGATLSFVTLEFIPKNGRASLPTNFPAFGIYRQKYDGTGLTALFTSGFVQYSTASLGTYNGGTALTLSLTPNNGTSNVIDRTQFNYFLVLWDESGTNAIAGNNFLDVQLALSSIANSAPG